ncbi:MAG: hypothetical protein ACRDD7_06395 [Peptostreptococcaceae bacterium]
MIICKTCLFKYDSRSCGRCRRCKWNTEDFFGRYKIKTTEDNYIYIDDSNSKLPF